MGVPARPLDKLSVTFNASGCGLFAIPDSYRDSDTNMELREGPSACLSSFFAKQKRASSEGPTPAERSERRGHAQIILITTLAHHKKLLIFALTK